jgi:hypothetical protein
MIPCIGCHGKKKKKKKEKRNGGQAFQKMFSCRSFAAMIRTKR